MCGILGFVGPSGKLPAHVFDLALGLLAHRGPDARGTWSQAVGNDREVLLGHTRLSILDLSDLGHQPMVSPRTGATIVYNGEVYNFLELRRQLEAEGYQFRSQCDTEVVLAAYDRWGCSCVEHLNGMFAIAIYDPIRRQVMLARDRVGIKPVYYAQANGRLVFGSELTAVLALKQVDVELRPDAAAEYFAYNCFPRDTTPLLHHHKLRPGFCLLYDIDRETTTVNRYWDALDGYAQPPWSGDEQELADRLEALWLDAVKIRLISDVPLGTFLSGGIDSSLVTALMTRVAGGTVKTFTIGFSLPEMDEAPFARKIAEHLGTEHHEQYVTPAGLEEAMVRAVDLYDEPFADSSCIPTAVLSEMTRKHVTVALSGDGGDELHYGYVRYLRTSQYRMFSRLPGLVRRPVVALLRRSSSSRHRQWAKVLEAADLATFYSRQIAPRKDDLVVHPLSSLVGDQGAADAQARLPASSWREVPPAADLIGYLPDDLLVKVDRASMGVALEVRVPLLDYRAVEFCSRIPTHMKYRNGITKCLMRRILGKYVPPELWQRPKRGFAIPIATWFRQELRPWLLDTLTGRWDWTVGQIRREHVERLIQLHLDGRGNHSAVLWALVSWRHWVHKVGLSS